LCALCVPPAGVYLAQLRSAVEPVQGIKYPGVR
jgi:hypothetical protein